MDLKDYLKAHQINNINVKDIPSITFVEDAERPKSRIVSCYMEINIDDIEDSFPLQINVNSFDINSRIDYIYLNKNDVFSN